MSARLFPRPLFRTAHILTPRRPITTPRRPFSHTTPRPSAPPPPPASKPTLSARLKSLSKEYGYSALGVYLALSALDFPFCFLAVRTIGSERIGEYEEVVVAHARGWWNVAAPVAGLPVWRKGRGEGELEELREAEGEGGRGAAMHHAGIWTELALAYAIHKSFIFVRVPLTAAVTPKVVKTLRGWGWDIGRKGAVRSTLEKAGKAAGKAGKKLD
ncbi:hypothetical protein BZA05DRAFT_344517 [Tricharina praecox]|uniref:uncharacterized protein n=1 Tax=Tricharina praecox TaxID=43433 RepID=UPI0022208579|nr:uncharacterized protein BZA05DRAFT_344517 [Tricharina praecox]KAI5842245.1 hypothetical protein BZA05DRAFT_344517 [Tricharina praecox]